MGCIPLSLVFQVVTTFFVYSSCTSPRQQSKTNCIWNAGFCCFSLLFYWRSAVVQLFGFFFWLLLFLYGLALLRLGGGTGTESIVHFVLFGLGFQSFLASLAFLFKCN